MLAVGNPSAVPSSLNLPARQPNKPAPRVPSHSPPSPSSWMAQIFSRRRRAVTASCTECAVMPVAHAALGPDPNIARPILRQRPDAEIGQALRLQIVGQRPVVPAREAFVGA